MEKNCSTCEYYSTVILGDEPCFNCIIKNYKNWVEAGTRRPEVGDKIMMLEDYSLATKGDRGTIVSIGPGIVNTNDFGEKYLCRIKLENGEYTECFNKRFRFASVPKSEPLNDIPGVSFKKVAKYSLVITTNRIDVADEIIEFKNKMEEYTD